MENKGNYYPPTKQLGRVWLDGFHGTQKQFYCNGKNPIIRNAALFRKYKDVNLQECCSPSLVFSIPELNKLIECKEKQNIILEPTANRHQCATCSCKYYLPPKNLGHIFPECYVKSYDTCGWRITLTKEHICYGSLLTVYFESLCCHRVECLFASYKVPILEPKRDTVIEPEVSKYELILDGFVFKFFPPPLKFEISNEGSADNKCMRYTALSNTELTCESFVEEFIKTNDPC